MNTTKKLVTNGESNCVQVLGAHGNYMIIAAARSAIARRRRASLKAKNARQSQDDAVQQNCLCRQGGSNSTTGGVGAMRPLHRTAKVEVLK